MKNLTFLLRHLLRRNLIALGRARALIRRERLPWPQLQARQGALLRATLATARRVLPHYAAIPVAPDDADIHAWLRAHYPVISKQDLIKGRATLYPNKGKRRPWWPSGKTSGTSGTPLEVFRSIDSVVWEEAFQLQFWQWAGYTNGETQAVLRGDQVSDIDRQTPPFWHWDRFGRQLFMSTRHLSTRTAAAMLDSMQASRPGMLRAYPSSGFELARLAEQIGHGARLRAVVTGSEPLFALQREQMQRAFACQVFDFYGMAERVAYAAQCEHGFYHVNPEYAWVEILDQDDLPTRDFGHVVGTTLHNHVMPLIRYRISDRARWVDGVCPCGRSYPRLELSSGKVEDQLYDREGTPVSASIITFAFKGLAHIRKCQVAQLGPGAWEIRIVPEAGYAAADQQALLDNVGAYISQKLDVTVRIVADIALMPSGKFKWVSQEWPGSHAACGAPR
ncbi:phenylacetate-CoA ligase [Janthinobacterium sp. CG_23.3]|uniref:phenylacetate--CoA ligase family protein n=1 Tax=Janthinobacterium sp. CG_23.3 TaxID=3349634 RepID=UPI0038D489D1